MSDPGAMLPSWRAGDTREVLIAFLEQAERIPVERRVAAFDNDGTLWCERPTYVQFEFFVDALRHAVDADPALAERVEFAAVLDADLAAMGEIGLARLAMALAELFQGETPDEFARRVQAFLATGRHPVRGTPLASMTYAPMLELIDELRRRQFTIAIVTGGGTEFVRAISSRLYGVPPELVVGTLIAYEPERDERSGISLRRTAALDGPANEGMAKVTAIQSSLGRRPILAAGNSAGDREMLEWSCSGDEPGLALLIDHDDEEREYRYASTAGTLDETEPITVVGRRLGWNVVSMANDWARVFEAPEHPRA